MRINLAALLLMMHVSIPRPHATDIIYYLIAHNSIFMELLPALPAITLLSLVLSRFSGLINEKWCSLLWARLASIQLGIDIGQIAVIE